MDVLKRDFHPADEERRLREEIEVASKNKDRNKQKLIVHKLVKLYVSQAEYFKMSDKPNPHIAIKYLQKALRIQPDHPVANYRLGFLHYREKRYAKAIVHLERALDGSETEGLNDTQSLLANMLIVTGASRSKGIGAAICRSLANAGADVFFTHWSAFDEVSGNGSDKDFPSMLCDELKNVGVNVTHMEVDLSSIESPGLIMDRVEETLGTPNILVNNATFESPANFRTLNREILDMHYKVNNSGTIMLSMEFAKRYEKAFPEEKNGRIINMVSKGPDPNNLAYIATKGMMIAITEPLSVGFAPIGITVNCVDPGPTDSGWINDELREQLLPLFPMGRIGVPEDAARLVTFLASDNSGWITGQTIKSEGGFLGK